MLKLHGPNTFEYSEDQYQLLGKCLSLIKLSKWSKTIKKSDLDIKEFREHA